MPSFELTVKAVEDLREIGRYKTKQACGIAQAWLPGRTRTCSEKTERVATRRA